MRSFFSFISVSVAAPTLMTATPPESCARNFTEAVQWLYFGYLGVVKEQNGAAMSLGRVSTFLDIYAEEELKNGTMTESEIQEVVDHFIMKLRIVRFLRTPAYDELFSGDPTWITESIGGIGLDGRHMVTKMSYRFLHTLENIGSAPEPKDRKSTRLNSSHPTTSRMPSSA